MPDLGSFTALVTAAGSVIGLANKANSVEANQRIIELQQRMAEVQQAFAELFQENQSLKEENRKLRDEISAEVMYPFREGVRWKKSTDGTEDDGPFCPRCFANKKVMMPLSFKRKTETAGSFTFRCPEGHMQATAPGREIEVTYSIAETSIKTGRYSFP